MRTWIKDLIPLLTTVFGGVVGWLVARYQQSRLESREKNKIILQKLEELHEALTRFMDNLVVIWHESSITEMDDAASRVIPRHLLPPRTTFKAEPGSEDRIKVLIGFYTPQLADQWQKIEEASGDFCEMAIRTAAGDLLELLGDKKEEAKPSNARAIIDQLDRIYVMCEEMKKKVVEISEIYR